LPTKAFATPFVVSDEEFDRACLKIDGLLLDRYRLLSAGANRREWLPIELGKEMAKWAKPRVSELPFLED
jgi:hypothetical protein